MDTVAVLPIKTFARAKHRLSEAVEPPGRRELAEAMVGDVLDALGAVDGLDGVIAVTAEPRAADAARDAGARIVHDGREAGQSAAAALGVAAAREQGAGACCSCRATAPPWIPPRSCRCWRATAPW